MKTFDQNVHVLPKDADCISRQAAIDALCVLCEKKKNCDKSKFVYNAKQDEQVIMCPEHYALSTLPPAQPAGLETLNKALEQEHKKLREMQKAQPEIIHCQNCKLYQSDHHWCELLESEFSLTDFCSYGERRTE